MLMVRAKVGSHVELLSTASEDGRLQAANSVRDVRASELAKGSSIVDDVGQRRKRASLDTELVLKPAELGLPPWKSACIVIRFENASLRSSTRLQSFQTLSVSQQWEDDLSQDLGYCQGALHTPASIR